jgi:hypothetical protein
VPRKKKKAKAPPTRRRPVDYRNKTTSPKTDEERVDLRNRIIARFDEATGSSGAATFGPLVDAIVAELFPADPTIESYNQGERP